MTRPQIGDMIAFTRDVRRIGRVVGWYDTADGRRTFVAEVDAERSPNSSDGRWHVTEPAATLVKAAGQ